MYTAIAVDGPAGAGKSTAAKRIAKALSYFYIDSGALFRAVTLKAIQMGIPMNDTPGIIHMMKSTEIDFKDEKVYLDGKDVSLEIRSNDVSANSSYPAKISEVRDVVADVQRKIAKTKNVVADGRDIGTTIFPHAGIKFFMIASVEERAKRRLLELNAAVKKYELQDMIDQINKRDGIDSTREVSPLKKADDAIVIDTDGKTIEEVVAEMLGHIDKRLNEQKRLRRI